MTVPAITNINTIKQQHIKFHNNNKHRFDIKRKCSCCSRDITTKDIMFIGETSFGVWYNCTFCNSTMLLPAKKETKMIV